MNPIAEDILMHYGMPRRSGRYPWGSGKDPYQHSRDFLSRVEELRAQGFTYTDENGNTYKGDIAIAKSMGMSSTKFRAEIGLCRNERRMLNVARAKSLKEDGLGDTEIGRIMGVNESTVRSWLKKESEVRMNKAQETAAFLKARSQEVISDGGMLDVGVGVELDMNVSKEKLNQAIEILKKEGYQVYNNRVPQAGNPGQYTTQKVLCPPGTPYKAIYEFDKIHSVKEYISRDGGESYEKKFTYPASLDSKRLAIRYADEGGIERDGLVEIRRGVPDLSLGDARFAQVRILVDGTHYIKGMAVYSDELPPGVDILFNSNKKSGTPLLDTLKEIKKDPDNPFGSAIKDAEQGGQYWYDPNTGERVSSKTPGAKLGLINKRSDEGDWSEWTDALPSQFLSKQSKALAQKQLNLAKADRLEEFDRLCALNNPTIKKHLLEKFADECDAAAVNLKAAALPGQKYHAIIPINSLKDNEVFAPNYENGTKLALVRYPHEGIFQIPIVTVNNKNVDANKFITKAGRDAIGINSNVAAIMSGADFDGDTVMCIPTHDPAGRVKISNREPLQGLVGYEAKEKYGPASYEGREVRLMTKKQTGMQMGIISNLITDMTLAGADDDELAAAVRHSMTVIDAHKHKLDYKQSEIDNNIAALHKKYQGKATGGASTIISKASSPDYQIKRQGSARINIPGTKDYDPSKPDYSKLWKVADDAYYAKRDYDKESGKVTYTTVEGKKITYDVKNKTDDAYYKPVRKVDPDTGDVSFTNSDGTISYKVTKRTQKSTKMAETDDAHTLVSEARHPMELLYADYANSMKALANRARKELVSTGNLKKDKSAAEVYKPEVAELNRKLKEALLNTPRERAAQRLAAAEVKRKQDEGLISEPGDLTKAASKAIGKYRDEVGAISRRKRNIEITDREWEAIQAGAISESTLEKILNNADIDSLRARATPRSSGTTLSTAQISRIKAMNESYTIAQIADKLGISPTAVSEYVKGDKK